MSYQIIAIFTVAWLVTTPLCAATRNILWQNPGQVDRKNLASGAGGAATIPRPPFRFVAEDNGGSSPKVKVRDARGNSWSVKFGEEVRSETFASRIAWVAGYTVEPTHFVAEGRILGVKGLTRAKASIRPDGSFHDARFQLRSQKAKFSKRYNWSWVNNPFLGTKELNGLKIVVMLVSDWDDKDARDIDRDANTAVFEERSGRTTRYLQFIPDWGGSMGKWGNVALRSKWDCKGYRGQNNDFIKGVKNGFVEWGYSGQRNEVTQGIRPADVHWLMQYLGRLTDAQLRAGLRASGAVPADIECFTSAIRDRLVRLQDVARR
jgi:hypothetical protein